MSPITTVGLTPARVATIPLGMAPTNAPAGYAAASTPAPVLPRPSVSAYRGSSGVSAAKKSVSKKTIALVRSRSLRTRLLCRSGMRVWLVRTCRPCVPRARARRHGVPARRQRVGSRRRDEPVGRRGLRASRLRLPPDPRALLPAHARSPPTTPSDGARAAAGEPADVAHRLVRAVPRRRRAGREGASEPADGGRAPRLQATRRFPLRFEPGVQPLRARRRRLPRRDRGEGEARRADGGERAAARSLPPRRRAVGGAGRLAHADVRGAGGRGAFVHARDAEARARTSISTRTTGLRCTAASKPSVRRRTLRSARPPGRCSSSATRSSRPTTSRRRAAGPRRSTTPGRRCSRCRTSSRSPIRTTISRLIMCGRPRC